MAQGQRWNTHVTVLPYRSLAAVDEELPVGEVRKRGTYGRYERTTAKRIGNAAREGQLRRREAAGRLDLAESAAEFRRRDCPNPSSQWTSSIGWHRSPAGLAHALLASASSATAVRLVSFEVTLECVEQLLVYRHTGRERNHRQHACFHRVETATPCGPLGLVFAAAAIGLLDETCRHTR